MAETVLELRVHGVAGTPPEAMLGVDRSDVVQVAGDDTTGFYRCAKGVPYGGARPDHVAVEAYSWGGLTSGVKSVLDVLRRAAWLILLPLALGNLAYWTRPDMAKGRRAGAVLMRLACLLLTLMLIATMFTIGVDLVGWQCFRGGAKVCDSVPFWLDFLDSPPWDSLNRRMLVGSLLPVAVLAALFVLSTKSLQKYESVEPAGAGTNIDDDLILRREKMWSGTPRTSKLRRFHTAAACALVVLLGSGPLVWRGYSPRLPWWLLLAGAVTCLLVAGFGLSCSFQDGLEFPDGPNKYGRLSWWTMVAGGSLLLCYGVGLYSFTLVENEALSPALIPGHDLGIEVPLALLVLIVGYFLMGEVHWWRGVLLGAVLVAVLVLGYMGHQVWGMGAWLASGVAVLAFVGAWVLHRWVDANEAVAWRGAGPAMVLGASVWIAALFTTATVVWVADYLNGGTQSVSDLQAAFNPAESPGLLAATLRADPLRAGGEVVVSNANLRVVNGSAVITSGRVAVGDLSQKIRAKQDNQAQQSASGSYVRLPGVDVNNMPVQYSGAVRLIDSSVIPCKPEGPHLVCDERRAVFVASGVLDLPPEDATQSRILIVAKPKGTIHIDSVKGLQEPLVVPEIVAWFSFALPFWFVGLVLALLCIWLGWVRPWRRFEPDDPENRVSTTPARDQVRSQLRADQRASSVANPLHSEFEMRSLKARMKAGFTHRAERLAAIIALITCVAALAIMVGASTAQPPWADLPWTRPLGNLGLWVALGVSLVIIGAAAKMRDSDGVRRSVGVLWDMFTFWPRVAHPFGPPCYAERVVPEIIDRVRWALSRRAGVILSAHSQGSVIAVAVVSQLAAVGERLEDIRVITYGSQIRMWYGRIFPAVYGAEQIGYEQIDLPITFRDRLPATTSGGSGNTASNLVQRFNWSSRQPHWVNLFRRSDPIGFRVFSDRDPDGTTATLWRADRYVSEYSPGSDGDPGPALNTHSRYQFSAVYEQTVRAWYQELSKPRLRPADEVLNARALVP